MSSRRRRRFFVFYCLVVGATAVAAATIIAAVWCGNGSMHGGTNRRGIVNSVKCFGIFSLSPAGAPRNRSSSILTASRERPPAGGFWLGGAEKQEAGLTPVLIFYFGSAQDQAFTAVIFGNLF